VSWRALCGIPRWTVEKAVTNGESHGTPVARFAAELRAWRQRHSWSQAELADKLGYSGSHVSSVETMTRLPTSDFAKRCDTVFGTPGTFERLQEDITRAAYPPWFSPFVHYEARAARIHCWDNRNVTGLLQTENYARAIIEAGNPDMTADEIERDVAARLERQQILHGEVPPYCWFVIHEAALRTVFGSKTVMRDEMDQLLQAARSPRVVVQVFPSSVPNCPGVDGAVTIFDFKNESSVGYAEGYRAGRTIEAPSEVASLVLTFDHLRALAQSPADSERMITAIRGEYDG
jgi:transcriptional regulator with XRE-family HTH domain